MQKKKPNMFTVGSSTCATFVLPVHHGTCVEWQKKMMETNLFCGAMTELRHAQKSAGDLASPTKKIFGTLCHGTCVALQTKTLETEMFCRVMIELKHVQKTAADVAIPTKRFEPFRRNTFFAA